jgi:hypothetical protein
MEIPVGKVMLQYAVEISVGRVLRGTENMFLISLNKNDNKIRAVKTFECKIYYSQWSEASDADNIK